MKFTWKLNKLFSEGENILGAHYSLVLTDDIYSVSTEGEHFFAEGTVNLPYADIKEYNLLVKISGLIFGRFLLLKSKYSFLSMFL